MLEEKPRPYRKDRCEITAAAPMPLPDQISRLSIDTSEAAHMLAGARDDYGRARENLQKAEQLFDGLTRELAQAMAVHRDGPADAG